MGEKKFAISEYTTGEDIRRIRTILGLTQKEFAMLVGSSKVTVERWERSEEPIRGPIVLLLRFLERHPNTAEEMRVQEKIYPLRLWYMHNQTVCTIIDVNEITKQVRIKNYTENTMFRAFGVIEMPDYEQYVDFLKTRCFPEGRDKMKLVLKDLDLPFYDPLMIIEKTEGRMAEDNFWIRIER